MLWNVPVHFQRAGSGNPKDIKERCDAIRAAMELTKSEYEKEKLQERLAKLSGELRASRREEPEQKQRRKGNRT